MSIEPETALSAAANMAIFGLIIWGALARRSGRRRALQAAICIPAGTNILIVLFKNDLTMDQRLIGTVVTLGICGAAALWLRQRSALASRTAPQRERSC